ncbi:hypothetical protein SUGI_0017030 [Cryptomeria japonica]|nr:hypothetical protein SUGI_0017030 [Cryptomeria japonica]
MLITTVLAFLVSVSAQPGFLSINCGGEDNYTDSAANITWISDGNYIDVGEVANVSNSSIPYHLQFLRYFPKPLNKSCYSLPLNINVTYLVRLWFLFGNYNGIQELPSFNVSLETQGMLMQKIQSISYPEIPEFTRERIITSSTNVLYVCLIRTSDSSDPFISAIELRSLSGGLYEAQLKPGIMLNLISRYDLGAQSSDLIRYPQDRFDRLWNSDSLNSVYNSTVSRKAHSNRMVLNKNNITGFPPAVVMQTALIAKTTVNRMRLILEQQNTRTLVVLYFAEVENLNDSEARNFNVMVNEQTVSYIDYALQNHSIELPFTYNYTQGSEVVISLETIDQPGKSSRGPLINAIEYYRIVESKPATYAGDVGALLSIKRAFIIKSWISDPCFGIEWSGMRCNKGLPVRILDIDLSERNLSGTLPQRISQLTQLRSISLQNNNLSGTLPDLCRLTKLEIIRLENNYLTGTIPDCLSQLSNLKQLNLENNNFSGDVPEGLLKNPPLILRYTRNPHLCKGKDKCHSNKSNKAGIVVKSTIGVAVPAFVAVILLIIYLRRHNSNKRNKMVNMNANHAVTVLNPVKSRSFSLVEMMRATQDLSQKIGEGGFGSVYFGKLQDGKDVAVKLLSSTSKQGATEFLNEIDLLSRLNHRNLVSLLGYCNDFKQLMLVYEHMPCGSLKYHLYGSLSKSSTLDWKIRLRVALDAAEGSISPMYIGYSKFTMIPVLTLY